LIVYVIDWNVGRTERDAADVQVEAACPDAV